MIRYYRVNHPGKALKHMLEIKISISTENFCILQEEKCQKKAKNLAFSEYPLKKLFFVYFHAVK